MRRLLVALLAVVLIQAASAEYTTTGGHLSDFKPEKKLKQIEESFDKGKPLAETLDKASAELAKMLKEYRESPTVELKTSIEAKFASYSRTIVRQTDQLLGEEDKIQWTMKELVRDLGDVSTKLAESAGDVSERVFKKKETAETMKAGLRELARRIKAAPGEEKELRREFRAKLRALKVLDVQVRSLVVERNNIRTWQNNLAKLESLFGQVGDHLDLLFDYLRNQRDGLSVALQTRKDLAAIEVVLHGGMEGGGASLRKIAVSSGALAGKLQNFQELVAVLTEISAGAGPGTISGELEAIERELSAGMPVSFDTTDEDLDKYIEFFARQEDQDQKEAE